MCDSSIYDGYFDMVLESNSTEGYRYDLGALKSKLFNLIFKGDFLGNYLVSGIACYPNLIISSSTYWTVGSSTGFLLKYLLCRYVK